MILTEAEEAVFKNNKTVLVEFFEKRISQLFDDILLMPKGEDRDAHLLMLKEYKGFLNSIKVISNDVKSKGTTLI